MTADHRFAPDYAVSPGATLKEVLEERAISQSDLAMRTGMAEKTISQIVNGVAPITYDTAEKLELALGVPASFWNRREMAYREAIARIEATNRLQADIKWLDEVPVKVLQQRGFVANEGDKPTLVRHVLQFFGVSNVDAWQNTWGKPSAQYRGKAVQERRPGYVAAWLRMGELQAESISAEPFDAGRFRRSLDEIRAITDAPAGKWVKAVPELCASAGVAVVFTKEISGASVSGATRWLAKDKALIQLSLKYKTDDQLWFTFFHEAGHILLHGKKQVFVEFGLTSADDDEREANAFARDLLIPPVFASRLPYLKSRSQICEFAKAVGVAPGIVVGRLQHDELAFPSAFNDLKRKLTWSK
jgi:HTH-type transcriptional regulator/antitoxin HigA